MNSTLYKLYLVSMVDHIIDGKTQTDLGDFALEYKTEFAEINAGDMVLGDACLAIATRLINKESGAVEYGNIFYKRLIKDSDAYSMEANKKLNEMLDRILESTPEEKLNFILKPESRILKTPFLRSNSVSPTLASFFGNLQYTQDNYPVVSLGGRFPKEAIPVLDNQYRERLDTLKDLNVDQSLINMHK